jgi:putative colanic acid biosynthesis acetyltransferase WcaF
MSVRLDNFDNSWYEPGRNLFFRMLWYLVNAVLMQNHLNPSSKIKVIALKTFGAKIGKGVILKPGVSVKYPWNLRIGDHTWIGENAWLDSLAPIILKSHVCISQGAYICTGNHDWKDTAFGLIVKPIVIEDGAWVGSRSMVMPGVTIASHSVITAGSVVSKDTEPFCIYTGNPAQKVRERKLV